MSEILSQEEIDALLSALTTGDVDANEIKEDAIKKIRVYDFKRPSKFSKEQMHTLQAMHENYARLLATFLAAHLRNVVSINVHSVEQLTYEEFIKSLPNPTILNIFSLEPLTGNAILEINPIIAFSIIDRLFGGSGQPPEKMRPLTDIEKVVIEKVVTKCLDILREAWENIAKFKPQLDMMENNPQFTQIVSPSEMVVLITFFCRIGEVEGLINLCLPYLVLEPVISKLSAHFWYASTSKGGTAEYIQALKKRIEVAKVDLCAVLGTAHVQLRELLELQKGDVIQLDNTVRNPVEIYIGSKKKFHGRPGVIGSKMAVQITSVCEEGEENDE